jgi:hypothetical protein
VTVLRKPRRYRYLHSLAGTVAYIDSGWSSQEWTAIEDAVSRMQTPVTRPYLDTSELREKEGALFSADSLLPSI